MDCAYCSIVLNCTVQCSVVLNSTSLQNSKIKQNYFKEVKLFVPVKYKINMEKFRISKVLANICRYPIMNQTNQLKRSESMKYILPADKIDRVATLITDPPPTNTICCFVFTPDT